MYELGLLALIGCLAGLINVLAGGGGLLALPGLVLIGGLGDAAANGTFRLAVLVQAATAVTRFGISRRLEPRLTLTLLIPTAIGAAMGAWQATTLGDGGTRTLLLGATLGATLLLIVGERLMPAAQSAPTPARARDAAAAAALSPTSPLTSMPLTPRLAFGLLVTGWYGGLIQAGVGFLLLLTLRRLGGLDLARANVVKVALVLGFTPVALAFFAGQSRVDVVAGSALAVGMAAGGWVGAGLALAPHAAQRIRWVVAVMVLVAAARLAAS